MTVYDHEQRSIAASNQRRSPDGRFSEERRSETVMGAGMDSKPDGSWYWPPMFNTGAEVHAFYSTTPIPDQALDQLVLRYDQWRSQQPKDHPAGLALSPTEVRLALRAASIKREARRLGPEEEAEACDLPLDTPGGPMPVSKLVELLHTDEYTVGLSGYVTALRAEAERKRELELREKELALKEREIALLEYQAETLENVRRATTRAYNLAWSNATGNNDFLKPENVERLGGWKTHERDRFGNVVPKRR